MEQITSALEKTLNISEAEKTSTDTEETICGTQQVSSDTEHFSSDTEISSTDEATSGTEKATSGTEKATSGTEMATSGTGEATSGTGENLEENSLELEVEDFCIEIFKFVFEEMKSICPNAAYKINDSEPQVSFSPEFILDVGRAVAFYALTYIESILVILKLAKYFLFRRPETLEPFLKNFFEELFDDLDDLPRRQFLVGVLAYCGFICVITDYFMTHASTMDFAEKCFSSFTATMISKFEKMQKFGGWEALHEIALPYTALYGPRCAKVKPASNPE